MDFELKEKHLSYLICFNVIVCLALGEIGLSIVGLAFLALGHWIIFPIREVYLKVNKSELELLKEEIDNMKLEINSLKIESVLSKNSRF